MTRVESWKWGSRPHYCLSAHRLGEDDHGVWLWAPAGNMVTRGEASFTTEHATIAVIPRDRWWTATWWLGHPEVDIYVNISTVPEWEGDVVSAIDLDLDVVLPRRPCGDRRRGRVRRPPGGVRLSRRNRAGGP